MAGYLLRTVEAQAAEVALDLSGNIGERIDSEGDGRGEGVDGLDGVRPDVKGHGLDLSLHEGRLDAERDLFCAEGAEALREATEAWTGVAR